jgi:CheY-specific phosphatase CheX
LDILTVAAEGAESVPQNIKENLLDAFIEAATVTFAEMTGVEVSAKGIYQKAVDTTLAEVSVTLPVFGPDVCDLIPVDTTIGEVSVAMCLSGTVGTLVLGFSKAMAAALAQRILPNVPEAAEEDMQYDCLGEIANVVAGQAKALLAETPYRFSFSTPSVIIGVRQEIWLRPDRYCLIIVFGSDLGNFSLQLLLWH